ncbi:MAG TPA: hypothetical protein VK949_09115 [Methylotenera sp.]|nr:hypothetical protein [Methylotenera sp.]
MSTNKVFLGTKKIQQLGRVSLDETVLFNLGIKIGDQVDIHYLVEGNSIVISKSTMPEKAKRGRK